MSDLIYSRGKLGATLATLAKHPGDIHERVIAAAGDFAPSNKNAMPSDETRNLWERIWNGLTDHGTERADVAIPRLSRSEAVSIAEDILELESHLDGAVEELLKRR